MTELQRYGIYVDSTYDEPSLAIDPEKDGDFVYYDEAKKRIAELEHALKEVIGLLKDFAHSVTARPEQKYNLTRKTAELEWVLNKPGGEG